jgi:uncharacterized protein (UPF0335 family)
MPELLNNLRDYVERVVKLHEERDELNTDIKAVYEEAKEAGFVTARLREVVREYRLDAETRHDRYAVLNLYRDALGLFADTELGKAAIAEAEAAPPRRRGRPRKNGKTASEWLRENAAQ